MNSKDAEGNDDHGDDTAPSSSFISLEAKSRLRSRDCAFLSKLFVEMNPYLFRVCAANDIFAEHAEDVIFNTWEKFFANMDHFRYESQISTFLCGILFNQIRQYRRSTDRLFSEGDSMELLSRMSVSGSMWETTPHDPHHLCEARQIGALIEAGMENLNAQQKSAFLMKEINDEPAEDICLALGVSPSHLRVLLFRAKSKLRRSLADKFDKMAR
jgi:RNA polymerase sigma-70 factor (ECF subfamily)